MLLTPKNSKDATIHPFHLGPCCFLLFVVMWFGVDVSSGQSVHSGLHVPAQVDPGVAVMDPDMFDFPGVFNDGSEGDSLSNYERSRLGRWRVAKNIKPDDSSFGIELKTPAGPVRIRFDATINGKSFRAAREKTIDELMAIAKGDLNRDAKAAKAPVEVVLDEPALEKFALEKPAPEKKEAQKAAAASDTQKEDETKEPGKEKSQVVAEGAEAETVFEVPEPHFAPSAKDRMIAYAKTRGDRLTRHELRRRVADIAGGPSLLRTTKDFGSQRNETMTLFAFLDTNEDGAISPQERKVAVKALDNLDLDVDGNTDWTELQLGLKPRTAKRKTSAASIDWQAWELNPSESIGDIGVAVAFNDTEDKSGLTIGECKLDEQWKMVAAKVQRPNAESPHGSVLLASRNKFSLALSAVQSTGQTNGATEQISIGVALGSNALFQRLDRDGDWRLNSVERDSLNEVITSLDTNADGTLTASELPILLRVCISRGATAHEALADNVSIVFERDEDENSNLAAPAWFTSMDKDGSRTLTRKEFLGDRKSFEKLDTDQNDLLSIVEALAAESD